MSQIVINEAASFINTLASFINNTAHFVNTHVYLLQMLLILLGSLFVNELQFILRKLLINFSQCMTEFVCKPHTCLIFPRLV